MGPVSRISVVLVALLATGCFSFRWGAVAPTSAPTAGGVDPFQVTARWVAAPNTVALTNASADPKVFSPAHSTLAAGGRTFALTAILQPTPPATTPRARTATVEPVTLAPGATVTVTLYPADGVFPAATPLDWGLSIEDSAGGSAQVLAMKVWPPAEHVYVTRAGTASRVACYITAFFYGGSCWFISPSDTDREDVTRRARAELGEQVQVEYLDRR